MFCARLLLYAFLILGLFSCVPAGQQAQKKSQQADVHYKLGISHLQGNNPTQALKELLIAVENGPDNDAIHVALAQAYQVKKAHSQAEQHYLKAIELSGNDPRYQNNLASLYLDMQQWDKAINYFDKAASNLLFSSAHIAFAGKGFAYYQKQDYPAALEQYKEAIALAPRYASAYLLRSEVYLAMGQELKAKHSLEKAIDIAPGFSQARYNLAVMLLKEQQLDEAKSHFELIVDVASGTEMGLKSVEMLRALKKQQPAQTEESAKE